MRRKKRFVALISLMALMAAWLMGCEKSSQTDRNSGSADKEILSEVLSEEKVETEKSEENLTEQGIEEGKAAEGTEISYGVPLSEIGEKIEYVYFRENRIKPSPDDYEELGMLPEEEKTEVLLYLLEGSKILFLPEEKANTVMNLKEESCPAFFSKKEECYLFFQVEDWWMEENAVPVTSPVSSTIILREVGREEGQFLYSKEDIQFLGRTEVVFSLQSRKGLETVDQGSNEYIKVATDYIAGVLQEAGYYGEFQIYINRLERMPCEYSGYSDVLFDAAVIGNGIREYVFFVIYDHNDIEGMYSVYEKQEEDSPGVLCDYPYEDQVFISHIVGNHLEVVSLTVTEENKTGRSDSENVPKSRTAEPVDISVLSTEELVNYISHAYSYAEWFGLNELAYQAGELRRFYGKEVAMYYWHNDKGMLYFVPLDKANHFIIDKEGKKCPVYVDKDGDMEFFVIGGANYQNNPGQLATSLVSFEYVPLDYADGLVWLGEEEVPLMSLEEMDLEPITEDGFTRELKRKIEATLTEAGKTGSYDIYLGEYSISDSNKVCISAAVTGEEEAWYFRFLMVRYAEEAYHFWPIGFGLNGKLEECEKDSYRMNAVCIERLIRLNRYSQTIQVGENWSNIL